MKNKAARVYLLALLLLSGCAGYKLGTMLPGDINSVFIPTFVNKSKEPLLEVETTSATVDEFQKDGSLEVVDAASADTVLNVTLTDYILTPVAYQRDTKTAAREYRLTIFAAVVLTRQSDNTVIAQNPRVKGETTFLLLGDLSSSKLQALPSAAEDLAHNIVEKVVEAWQ
jgi:hypothetical protein